MISSPFLREIAGIILNRFDYNLTSLCLVFPNKRARLYLSRYMGEIISKPIWAPRYFTISELMETIAGYHVADRVTLLFELYNSYIAVTSSTDSFDSFYPYSETLLADFDEIDKYLINADDLFRNLSDLKNLDGKFNYLTPEQLDYIRRFWSTFSGEMAESKTSFISIWESLSAVYSEFGDRLKKQQLAYEGMVYRKVAENPGNVFKVFDEETRFVFIGFNALSSAEDKLFMSLKNAGKADFFWDYDNIFLQEIHEAGTFIRNNIKRYPESQPLNHEHFRDNNLKIVDKNKLFFIPVYSNSGQALVLPDVLERLGISDTPSAEKTAIVLADEGLLINTLYAVPGAITDINVTMGYPLGNSAIFSLIDSLYELNRNARKDPEDRTVWYLSDVMSVMNNPLVRNRYIQNAPDVRKFALEKHLVYLTIDQILPDITEDIIFNDHVREDTINYLLEVVTSVVREIPSDKGRKPADPVQVEMLFGVYTFLTRLHDIFKERHVEPTPDTLFRLIRKMLRNMRIPFSGEPLAGLQILGILETRTLDFDNVIVLSANEGILPKLSEKPSFIPYNIRAGFSMPTPEHHDAIYAYYFYRLIQRARNVALIYDGSSGGLQTGERSRFLHQLKYDMKLNIEQVEVGSSISQIAIKPVIINKTEEVYKALSVYMGEKGRPLSPSAINEYLNCPVKFYFHHIAGLRQPDEAGEDVDARLFGNLIHHALRRIYSEFGTETVTAEKIRKMRENEDFINDSINRAFNEEFFGDKEGVSNRKPEGFNLIVRQVIKSYINQFLKTEVRSTPFTILSLEERHYATIPVRTDRSDTFVSVGGVIDRIDLKNGFIRILDYKTGEVKNKINSVGSLFDKNEKKRSDAVFQVLLYSYVYRRLNSDSKVTPGLFFFRQCHQENFSESISIFRTKLEDFRTIEPEFEQGLQNILEGLFNKDEPFMQTDNAKICGYCPYAGLCRRQKSI